MSEENRSSNVLAVTLVVAVAFQIFLSVLILNELRALPGKMPAAINKMEAFVNEVEGQARSRKLDASTAEEFLVRAEALIGHLVAARSISMK